MNTPKTKNENGAGKPTRSRRLFTLTNVIVLLGFMGVCWGTYSLLFVGANPGPTIIEELRTSKITEADIRSIKILKFDPGAGWPFSESDYSRKASKQIDPEATEQLIELLTVSTTNGHKHRNHPATFYYGIFRLDLIQGGHFYIFYHLGYYNNQYYVYLDANSLNSTNPNGADEYESIPLATFLKIHDPWYRDADSPKTRHRPSYPDNVQ